MNDTLIRELIAEHKQVAATLKKAKDKELKLRLKIVKELFPNAKKGTNKASLKAIGLDVKAVIKENWSVANNQELDDLLEENPGLSIAFKTKLELALTGYKTLDDDDKALLANNVTCKEGSPELTYEGELGDSMLSKISTKDGVLLINGEVQGSLVVDQTARYFGFQFAEELVKTLEEIQ